MEQGIFRSSFTQLYKEQKSSLTLDGKKELEKHSSEATFN